MPFPSSGRGGALVSATSTSPLGSTYSHGGCSTPCAKAATVVPSAPIGFTPAGHPFAVATLTSGRTDVWGGGRSGCGPTPAESGNCAAEAHAETTQATMRMVQRFSMQIALSRSHGTLASEEPSLGACGPVRLDLQRHADTAHCARRRRDDL